MPFNLETKLRSVSDLIKWTTLLSVRHQVMWVIIAEAGDILLVSGWISSLLNQCTMALIKTSSQHQLANLPHLTD